jgi:hypothetical protein
LTPLTRSKVNQGIARSFTWRVMPSSNLCFRKIEVWLTQSKCC